MISIFLLIHNIPVSFGCRGGTEYPAPPPATYKPRPTTTTTKPRIFPWEEEGFKPSRDQQYKWSKWLEDHERREKERLKNLKNPNSNSKYINETERGPGSGWPESWKDLPDGRGAQDPPPWAIIPNSAGKPEFCFLPPVRGRCRAVIDRWAFNPYSGQCQKFIYSDCGGNSNNFYNKKRCEQACLKVPFSSCLKYDSRRDGTALEGHPC